jgi:toxin ParE1/3/4
MLNLYIRPAASEDIDEIIDYLVGESAPAAQGFVKDLQQCFDLIAKNPKVGAPREYQSAALSGMRMFPLKKFSTYLVFYLSDEQTIDIVRVLHGRRDIEQLFVNSDR